MSGRFFVWEGLCPEGVLTAHQKFSLTLILKISRKKLQNVNVINIAHLIKPTDAKSRTEILPILPNFRGFWPLMRQFNKHQSHQAKNH